MIEATISWMMGWAATLYILHAGEDYEHEADGKPMAWYQPIITLIFWPIILIWIAIAVLSAKSP